MRGTLATVRYGVTSQSSGGRWMGCRSGWLAVARSNDSRHVVGGVADDAGGSTLVVVELVVLTAGGADSGRAAPFAGGSGAAVCAPKPVAVRSRASCRLHSSASAVSEDAGDLASKPAVDGGGVGGRRGGPWVGTSVVVSAGATGGRLRARGTAPCTRVGVRSGGDVIVRHPCTTRS